MKIITSNIVTSISDTSGVVLSDVDINKTSYKEKYESLRYFKSKRNNKSI